MRGKMYAFTLDQAEIHAGDEVSFTVHRDKEGQPADRVLYVSIRGVLSIDHAVRWGLTTSLVGHSSAVVGAPGVYAAYLTDTPWRINKKRTPSISFEVL